MKRAPGMTDEEWQDELDALKSRAEQRMAHHDATFQTLEDIHGAAMFWYGSTDRDSVCLAENRLMRGEVPE